MSTPAWNPSSRTPLAAQNDDWTPSGPSSSALPVPGSVLSQENIQHRLLNPQLVGMRLKVVVNNEEFKKKAVVAVLMSLDGRLSLRHSYYNKWLSLAPESVTPKQPHPTRDNGLLVVIEGEHCGKYVRRIHHRYENGQAISSFAVVAKNADGSAADRLTEERVEVAVDFLCLGDETASERKMGDSLMNSLRDLARVHRAK